MLKDDTVIWRCEICGASKWGSKHYQPDCCQHLMIADRELAIDTHYCEQFHDHHEREIE